MPRNLFLPFPVDINEALVRMELVRNSDAYKAALEIPRDNKKERQKAFSDARSAYRYSDYDLQAYATVVSNESKWIAQKLNSNTQQTIATRAFRASVKVMFGRAKKVRYRIPSRFKSLEGKTNKQGIRWKDGQWSSDSFFVNFPVAIFVLMDVLRFEWDDGKSQSNFRKHGVSFDEAVTVFYDPLYIEDYDDAHSDEEDWFKVIGESSVRRLLVVIYVERAGIIRIISSRFATKNERRYYESED